MSKGNVKYRAAELLVSLEKAYVEATQVTNDFQPISENEVNETLDLFLEKITSLFRYSMQKENDFFYFNYYDVPGGRSTLEKSGILKLVWIKLKPILDELGLKYEFQDTARPRIDIYMSKVIFLLESIKS